MKKLYISCLSMLFLSSALAAADPSAVTFPAFTVNAYNKAGLEVEKALKINVAFQVNCILTNTSTAESYFNYSPISMSFGSTGLVNPITNSYSLNGQVLILQPGAGWLNGELNTFTPDNVLTINNVIVPSTPGTQYIQFQNNSNMPVRVLCEAKPVQPK